MTVRYDLVDNFFHTLMRELSHIVPGHVTTEPVFNDLETAVQDGHEHDADRLAQNTFIPDDAWAEFMSHRVSTMSICALAAQLSISPAIVAGRYRYEQKSCRAFGNLVGHGEVRRIFLQSQPSRGRKPGTWPKNQALESAGANCGLRGEESGQENISSGRGPRPPKAVKA